MHGKIITTVNGHENFYCYVTNYRMDAGWWNTIDIVTVISRYLKLP